MFVYFHSRLVHNFPPDGDLHSSEHISPIPSSFKMMTLSILDHDAHPPTVSPLFTTLPAEMRLKIYTFVFMGCQATVWFDAEFVGEYPPGREYFYERWQGRNRKKIARDGHCCFGHSGGGFGLLATCRMVYVEAFQTYWSETALRGTRHIRTWRRGCELQQVCFHLPAAIKANLGHLQNIKLPRLENDTPSDDDTNSAPSLLRQFPKLKTCAFLGCPPLAKAGEPPYISGVPDVDNFASDYRGLGPFHLKEGETSAAYLERRYGIQKSCRIAFLSTILGFPPEDCPDRYERRVSLIPMYVFQIIIFTDELGNSPSISTLTIPPVWSTRPPIAHHMRMASRKS